MPHPTFRSAAAALALVVPLAAGCASASTKAANPATTVASAATPTSTSPTPAALPPAGKTYAVGSRSVTWVDHTRKTKGDAGRRIAAANSRTLPVDILYPAAGTPAAGNKLAIKITPDAAPAPGAFPVVVFSHGVTASGPLYAPFLAAWVAAGYVVAAPTYPMTSGGGAWADLSDYQNQPADVSFVITQLAALNRAKGPLAGHLDMADLAAAGHSLGAITSLGFYNGCCADKRIKAVVALSGIMLPFGKTTFDTPPSIPLLMIHGEVDGVVPYAGGSKTTFAKLTSVPRALLSFPKSGHTDVVSNPTYLPSTDEAVIAFLDLELEHRPAEWSALGAGIAAKGVGTLQIAGGLPKSAS